MNRLCSIVALVLSCLLLTALCDAGSFEAPVNYAVNPSPTGIVTGDFNRDGIVDLAVVVCGDADCINPGSVQVLFGSGDGTFTLGGTFIAGPDGTTADTLAADDFNGDGVPDLVVVNNGFNQFGEVSVLIADGNGGFLPPVSYAVDGASPVWVAVGDFNGDHKIDIAVSVTTADVVSILLGNGDGTFQTSVPYPAESSVQGITVADVNHDGKLDIVTANECGDDPACRKGTVSVLLGNGDGTFQPEMSNFAGIFPLSVAVGDFNHDGNADIAVALPCGTDQTCVSNGAVGILLGNGDGTFQPVVTYPSTGLDTARLAVGDFNHDHHPDIVAANAQGSDVSVYLANRNGTLQKAVDYVTDATPISFAIGDFNGDGALDVGVANEFGSDVSVMLNTGGTKMTLTSSPNPSQAGQAVQFTATVTAGIAGVGTPSGTVTFMTGRGPIGTVTLVNGTAEFSDSNFAAGTYWVHAVYSGDEQFQSNRSSRLKQVVKP